MEEGSLMRTLIIKGLITEEMMAQLHREWKEAQGRTYDNSDSDSDSDSVSNREAEQRTSSSSDSDSDSDGVIKTHGKDNVNRHETKSKNTSNCQEGK